MAFLLVRDGLAEPADRYVLASGFARGVQLMLVVEDDEALHPVLDAGLSDHGFELILAKDG